MPTLDPRSIILVLLVVTAGLAVQLVLTALRRRTERALRVWTLAAFLGVAGIVMFVARGMIPDWISIWLSNTVIAATYLTIWLGLRVFDARPVPLRTAAALLGAFAALFGVMYLSGAGLPARIQFVSLCMSALCFTVVYDLASDRSLPSRVFAAGLLGTQATLFFLRAIATSLAPPGEDFMKPDTLQIVFLVLQATFAPLWIVSLLAMTGERAQALLAASLAEQQHASEAKSEFLRRLAHEVRTPLGAVTGFAELMRETSKDPTTRVQAGHILTAAGHVVALSDELLDLARIEAGKVAIEPRDVDVAATVDEALGMLRATFDARRMRVALHTPAPVRLSADPRHLRQILLNVLGNAAKFGRYDGHVELRLWADEEGAHITIADNGPGIAAADPDALFEPFARGEGTSGVEGSGLGLPIVKGLVEAHGGRVAIETAPGKGTTVHLQFPASRVRSPSA